MEGKPSNKRGAESVLYGIAKISAAGRKGEVHGWLYRVVVVVVVVVACEGCLGVWQTLRIIVATKTMSLVHEMNGESHVDEYCQDKAKDSGNGEAKEVGCSVQQASEYKEGTIHHKSGGSIRIRISTNQSSIRQHQNHEVRRIFQIITQRFIQSCDEREWILSTRRIGTRISSLILRSFTNFVCDSQVDQPAELEEVDRHQN